MSLEMSLDQWLRQESPECLQQQMNQITSEQVAQSLSKPKLDEQDLLRLLSPAALPFLEPMARRSQVLTRQRFGRVMKLYAPLYVSNECTNACVYCGFNQHHAFSRKTLSLMEVKQQAEYLAQRGFQNLLLVSGESRARVPITYLADCIRTVKPLFPEISIEIYPLETDEYHVLREAGVFGLTIYQETYLPEAYAALHPSGRKKDYAYRLETPARGAQAALRQVGLGVLLGLSYFRLDAYYLARHVRWLEKKYWRTGFGVSFPRMRAAEGGFSPLHPVSDAELVQMILALRLYLPDAPFSLSTREPGALRKYLLPLGFTQVSAESCTIPGGYGQPGNGLAQFQVEDQRSAREMAAELEQLGFEPVWKDWDPGFEPGPAAVAQGQSHE